MSFDNGRKKKNKNAQKSAKKGGDNVVKHEFGEKAKRQPKMPYVMEARSKSQEKMLADIETAGIDVIFGVGPAGTGKTHIAVARALHSLRTTHEVDKIILARPAVGIGKDLGALPGSLEDKLAPFMRPLYDELNKVLGNNPGQVQEMMLNGTLEIGAVEFMRGRTFENAFVIVDEAQNCTIEQMKMILTRLGEGSTMVVTGDPDQIDLPNKADSGLKWILDKLEGKAIPEVSIIRFAPAEIIRKEVVRKLIEAWTDPADTAEVSHKNEQNHKDRTPAPRHAAR